MIIFSLKLKKVGHAPIIWFLGGLIAVENTLL
jgi:hypothetical protein